jgi:hypothetical protein
MNSLRLIPFFIVTIFLAGCGSVLKPEVGSTARTSAFLPTPPWRAPNVGVPLMWVADMYYMTAFSLSENGNVPPIYEVGGSHPGIDGTATATAPNGDVYVLGTAYGGGQLDWQVLEFHADANGDVKPFDTLNCGVSGSTNEYLAVGPHGKVAVETFATAGEIDILPAGSIGCSRGYSVITGSNTGLALAPLAIGPLGAIYTISSTNAIIVFQPGAIGNVAPHRSIFGRHTRLAGPNGIAVDNIGRIYVSNLMDNSITVYHSNAKGDASPMQRIMGPNTELYFPGGIAVSSDGRIFVANHSSNSITVYAAGANGNASPIQVIAGSATGLQITASGTQISIAVK